PLSGSRKSGVAANLFFLSDVSPVRFFELAGTCATGGPMQPVPGSGEEMIRVLVADDTRIHTQLLADALRRDSLLEVISSPLHSRDLVEAARAQKIDVVVLSASLDEDPQRRFEVLRELRVSDPQIRAVMLLDSSKRESILQAFRVGARGIFSRHESVENLSKC